MINKFIDKIYLINLKKRKDRLKSFKSMLDNCQNVPEIIITEAIDGKLIEIDTNQNMIINNTKLLNYSIAQKYFNCISGEIGCSLSHYFIWKEIIKSNKASIIFEDDVILNKEFFNIILKLINEQNIPNDLDILYFGMWTKWDQEKFFNKHISKNLNMIENENFYKYLKFDIKTKSRQLYPYNYLITPKTAEKLCNMLDNNTYKYFHPAIDHFIHKNLEHEYIFIMKSKGFLSFAPQGNSDIQSNIKKNNNYKIVNTNLRNNQSTLKDYQLCKVKYLHNKVNTSDYNSKIIKKKIYIATENQGFHEKTFFLYWLRKAYPNYNFIYSDSYKPNIVIKSVISYKSDDKNKISDKYKDLPIIHWTGESSDISSNFTPNDFNIIITPYRDNNKYTINLPFCTYLYHSLYESNFKKLTSKKLYMIAYCYSNKIDFRENCIDYLIKKINDPKKISFLGNCKRDECRVLQLPRKDMYKNLIKEYSNHKFVIAFENIKKKGYITEKIITAFMSGAIPIYWGDNNYAKKLFNPKAFISVDDYNSIYECLDYILNLTESKIDAIMKEPIFKNNIIPDIFNYNHFYKNSVFYNLVTKLRELNL